MREFDLKIISMSQMHHTSRKIDEWIERKFFHMLHKNNKLVVMNGILRVDDQKNWNHIFHMAMILEFGICPPMDIVVVALVVWPVLIFYTKQMSIYNNSLMYVLHNTRTQIDNNALNWVNEWWKLVACTYTQTYLYQECVELIKRFDPVHRLTDWEARNAV